MIYQTVNTQINVRLVFFDIKNIGRSFGVVHRDLSVTQIIFIGELVKDGRVVKTTTQKGQSKTIQKFYFGGYSRWNV